MNNLINNTEETSRQTPIAMLFRCFREPLQSRNIFPPTYYKVANFAEQGMSKRKSQRQMDITFSFIDETIKTHAFYEKQMNLLKIVSSSVDVVSQCLVPYAVEHYKNTMLSLKDIKETYHSGDEVFQTFTHKYRVHKTEWTSKSCTDCNMYSSSGTPCAHLFAVWRDHKGKGILHYNDNNVVKLLDSENMVSCLKHLYAKCYLVDTMRESLNDCEPILPASLDSSYISSQSTILLKKNQAKRGPPQQNRIKRGNKRQRLQYFSYLPTHSKENLVIPSTETTQMEA
jgi:hypothetical protein